MISRNAKHISAALIVGAGYSAASPAYSQGNGGEGDGASSFALEEIIVTARKRQETLQESPVAITALDASALQASGVANLKDLQQQSPGLTFADEGFKSAAIFIRGVGQRETTALVDPGVGVYINDIYIARTDSQLLDTVDTESIQILRGPQGTLFGKNSTGGAILVTTIAPEVNQFNGYVSTRLGNYGRRDAKVSANIPLNDSVAARISLNSIHSDGYLKNVHDGDIYGDEERLAATGALNWQINDAFNANLFGYWSKQKELGAGVNCLVINPGAQLQSFLLPSSDHNPSGTSYSDACNKSAGLAKDSKIDIDGPSRFEMTNTISALTLSWEVDDLTIKSISSFSFQDDVVIQDDVDATSLAVASNGTVSLYNTLDKSIANGYGNIERPGGETRQQASQEFQLTGSALDEDLSYTLGLFYAQENLDNVVFSQLVGYNGYSYYDYAGGVILPQFRGGTSDLTNKTYAAYGQTTYDFTDDFNVTAGIRYTREYRDREARLYTADCEAIAASGLIPGASGSLCSVGGVLTLPVDPTAKAAALQNFMVNPPAYIPIKSAGTVSGDDTFSKLTPAITLAYTMTDSMFDAADSSMVYFTWSKGFKAGGFEVKGLEMQKFDPENVTNYEIGWKLDAFNHRFRFNTAAYQMDYRDLQVRVSSLGPGGIADLLTYFDNAGRAQLRGLEIEAFAVPADHLSVQLSLNFLDAKYKKFETSRVDSSSGLPVDVVDDRIDEPYGSVPELTASLSLAYDWISDIGRITPRFTISYQDELYLGLDGVAGKDNYQYAGTNTPNDPSDDKFGNLRELSTIDSVTLANFRLSYWDLDEVFGLTLFVNNLTDKTYYAGGSAVADGLGAAHLSQGTPRTYGLEAIYNFE